MSNSNNLLKDKVVNARFIKEAVALVQLSEERHPVFSDTGQYPLNWGIDKPLCRHCWQELAAADGVCPICSEMLHLMEVSVIKVGAGILVSCPYASDILNAPWEIPDTNLTLIGEDELLILLPHDSVAEGITFLHERAYREKNLINIVFPGQEDIAFGDALAMARYFAENAASSSKGFLTKLFFSHSHMRSFDFEDYLPFDITRKLFETAAVIKSVFPGKDCSAIREILKKDRVNRVYELNRFYSMCNQNQKAVLDRIQIDNIDPAKALLLFQIVRYVR